MIPREYIINILLLSTSLAITNSEETKHYDTSDWIPITDKCSTCFQNEQQDHVIEKKATGRVLTIGETDPKRNNLDSQSIPVNQQNPANVEQLLEREPLLNENTPDVRRHLNEGEYMERQYFLQPPFQQPQNHQKQPQQFPRQVQAASEQQLIPQHLLVPQNQQYYTRGNEFPPQPLLNVPFLQGPNVNLYQTNAERFPVNKQQTIQPPQQYQTLNPGVHAINNGLSGNIHNNNNFNDYRQVSITSTSPKPQSEKETVQLLYVPLESLNNRQQPNERYKSRTTQFRTPQELQLKAQKDARQRDQLQNQQAVLLQQQNEQIAAANPEYQIQTVVGNSNHKQSQLQSIQNDFAQQALDALKLQFQFEQEQVPQYVQPQVESTTHQTIATQPTSPKRKPHQPPLAVYMEAEGDVTITDVLSVLKNAKSISVQDTVGPASPQIFVGPHNLEAPEGYAKFDLPYLNALDTNRVERKVDQLPFFVAPLSYKAPDGYSKIPLPAPHVGSVVVSQKQALHEKHISEQPTIKTENIFNQQPYRLPDLAQYQLSPVQRPIKQFKPENVNPEQFPLNHRQQAVFNSFSTSLGDSPTPTPTVTSRPNPLTHTINQYELEQINSQFIPHPQLESEENEYKEIETPQQQHNYRNHRVTSTTPVVEPTKTHFNYETQREVQSTVKPEVKSRYTIRPNHRIPQSTLSNRDKNKYTVLEEFSIKRDPTTTRVDYVENTSPSTAFSNNQQYSVDFQPEHQQAIPVVPQRYPQEHHLPAHVSQLIPQPTPHVHQQSEAEQTRQQVYSVQQQQDENGQQIVQLTDIPRGTTSNSPVYFQEGSNVRFIDSANSAENTYRVINQQEFQQEIANFQGTEGSSTTPNAIRSTDKPSRSRTPHNKSRGKSPYIQNTSEEVKNDSGEENYRLPSDLSPIEPGLHSLINDLQDQAIRPLLVPASIAPTTIHTPQSQHQHHSVRGQEQSQEDYLLPQQHPQQHPPEQVYVLQQQPQGENVELQPIHQQPQYVLVTSTEAEPIYTTPSPPPVTTPITIVTTTTAHRRVRGRQRAQISTSTYSPRATAPRTRPTRPTRPPTHARTTQSRYQKELVEYPEREISSYTNDRTTRPETSYETVTSEKPSTRQRFRTRGRPLQDALTERASSSTSGEEIIYKKSQLVSDLEDSPRIKHPPSYVQFEQPDEASVKNYVDRQYQVYTIASTEPAKPNRQHQQLNVDVLINHPITETANSEPIIISQVDTDSPYVRYNSHPEQIARLHGKHEYEETTKSSHSKTPTRGRGRSRIQSTTHKPTTTISRLRTTTNEESEEEFYGFIRTPNFNTPSHIQHRTKSPTIEPKLYSATYVSNTPQPEQSAANSYEQESVSSTDRVQFIGKIQPKYPVYNAQQEYEDQVDITTEPVTTEKRYTIRTSKPTFSPKARVRGRLRLPSTKSPQKEQLRATAAADPPKFKQRGSSHFHSPLRAKGKVEDDDVEGGNYPVSFLKPRATPTEAPKFQITIDPGLEENYSEDQVPYSSIYNPKIVPHDSKNSEQFYLASDSSSVNNEIPIDRKNTESDNEPEFINDEQAHAEKLILGEILGDVNDAIEDEQLVDENVEETSSTTVKPKGRRRGAWRLVKRPVDTFETAETQYVGRINSNSLGFNEKDVQNVKVSYKENDEEKTEDEPVTVTELPATPPAEIYSSTTEESFLDSLYTIFEMEEAGDKDKLVSYPDAPETEPPPYSADPIKSEELQEIPLELSPEQDSSSNYSTSSDDGIEESLRASQNITESSNSQSSTDGSLNSVLETLHPVQGLDFGLVKTSTSTEISHETEICYRGKCVKSSGKKNPTL